MVRRFSSSASAQFVAYLLLVASIFGIRYCGAQERAETNAKAAVSGQTAEQRIQSALDERIDVDFVDTPLVDVAEFLSRKLGIDLTISKHELKDDSLDAEQMTVTLNLKQVSARAALRLALRDLDLTYTINDEAVTITTPTAAERNLKTVVYPASDLVVDNLGEADYQSLIELLTTSIQPETWDDVGGPGNIKSIHGTLAISQTQAAHDEIQSLLAALRTGMALQYDANRPLTIEASASSPTGQSAGNLAIYKALKQTTKLDVTDVALTDFAELLAEQHKIPIYFDRRALEDDNLDVTVVTVTLKTESTSLPATLNRALKPLDLTWTVDNEVLIITTPTSADGRLIVKAYPIEDLVRTTNSLKDMIRVVGPFVMDPTFMDRMKASDPNKSADNQEHQPGDARCATCGLASIGYGFGISGNQVETTTFPARTSGAERDFDSLIETIESTIYTDSWDEVGGPGAIQKFEPGNMLVVSQTAEVHTAIGKLLTDLRARRPVKPEPAKPVDATSLKQDKELQTVVAYRVLSSKPNSEQTLTSMIQRFIAPETWTGERSATIHEIQGAILVEQTEENHRKIFNLLKKLSYGLQDSPAPADGLKGHSLGGAMSGPAPSVTND